MLYKTFPLFDDFVYTTPTGGSYSNADLIAVLGQFDQLALHAILDNVTGAGTVNVFVEHSAEAKHWMQRNSMVLGTPPASTTGDLSITVAVGGVYQLLWADGCSGTTGGVVYTGGATSPKDTTNTPLLPFVRLRIVTTAGTGCHLRIIAAQRGLR